MIQETDIFYAVNYAHIMKYLFQDENWRIYSYKEKEKIKKTFLKNEWIYRIEKEKYTEYINSILDYQDHTKDPFYIKIESDIGIQFVSDFEIREKLLHTIYRKKSQGIQKINEKYSVFLKDIQYSKEDAFFLYYRISMDIYKLETSQKELYKIETIESIGTIL